MSLKWQEFLKTAIYLPTIGLCLLIVFIPLASCSGSKKVKLKLDSYVQHSCKGRDGAGEIEFAIDTFALAVDMWGDEEVGEISDKSKLDKLWEKESDFFTLASSLVIKATKSKNLSNGEKIDLTAAYDEELAKKLKIQIDAELAPVTVKGLEEVELVDIFDYVGLSYEGTSPYIRVIPSLYPDNPFISLPGWMQEIKLQTDKKVYRNGEQAQVSVLFDEKVILDRLFIKIETKEKDYPVQLEYELVTDPVSVGDANYARLKNEASDRIKAHLVNDPSSIFDTLTDTIFLWHNYGSPVPELVGDIKPLKSYLLCLKDDYTAPQQSDFYNLLVLPFEATVTYPEKDKQKDTRDTEADPDQEPVQADDDTDELRLKLYYAIYCKDLVSNADGEVDIDIAKVKITKESKDIKRHYQELVTSNMGEYTVTEIDAAVVG